MHSVYNEMIIRQSEADNYSRSWYMILKTLFDIVEAQF